MRYSIDVTGVTAVASAVAAESEDVPGSVGDALAAVDDAGSALRVGASGVAAALDAVFAARRQSGPGIGVAALRRLDAVQHATAAFVVADDTMADIAARLDASSESGPMLPGRGFGPRAVL